MIVVSVTPFSGTTTPDKNGEQSVMLQCVAGKMPNRNVLSGTVAKRAGIEVGKTYLMQVRETGFDALFGVDFTFVKVRELSLGEDIAKTCKELGFPTVITVKRPDGFAEKYQRKGDAVESNRTKRIKEGLYTPIQPVNYEHETASEVRKGTSQEALHSPAHEDLP